MSLLFYKPRENYPTIALWLSTGFWSQKDLFTILLPTSWETLDKLPKPRDFSFLPQKVVPITATIS